MSKTEDAKTLTDDVEKSTTALATEEPTMLATTTEESTSWKPLMMPPVNVAEIMSTSSQTMRFFARAKGLVLR